MMHESHGLSDEGTKPEVKARPKGHQLKVETRRPPDFQSSILVVRQMKLILGARNIRIDDIDQVSGGSVC